MQGTEQAAGADPVDASGRQSSSASTVISEAGAEPFRLLFENSVDAVLLTDGDDRLLEANGAACEMFGFAREQMLGRRLSELVSAEPPDSTNPRVRELPHAGKTGMFRCVRPDHSVCIASYSVCRLEDARYLSILRDITAQRREQETATTELARQARLFDTVLSSIVDFAYVFDRGGRITYVNQALLTLWNRTLQEALGKNFHELGYPKELASRLQSQIQSVFDTGQPLRDETPFTSAAGSTGWYEYIFAPVFGSSGQVEAVAGSTRDITVWYKDKADKEELVRALEVERARLSEIFMQAPAFIAVLRGPQHVYERVNPPYVQILGGRELLGKSVREAIPEIEGQGFYELLDEVYRTGTPYIGKDIPITLRSKEEGAPPDQRFLDFVYQPLVEADGTVSGIFVHGVDLTERKSAEEALLHRQAEIEVLNHRLRRAMTETHHRVKNNLQLISALIDLQKQEGQETVPISQFVHLGHNIQALGIIHDILTLDAKSEGDTGAISVNGVLERFLPLLQSTFGDRRLILRLEEVFLPGKPATSVALIANEFVSNAIKHSQGDIELTLRVEDSTAFLEVCDDGPGFASDFDPETAAHTGLALVENIARYDLGARIDYKNRPEGGGRVVLTFPIASA